MSVHPKTRHSTFQPHLLKHICKLSPESHVSSRYPADHLDGQENGHGTGLCGCSSPAPSACLVSQPYLLGTYTFIFNEPNQVSFWVLN